MTITEEKKQFRQRMLQQRAKLEPSAKEAHDQFICGQLEQLILEKGCGVVHAYIPMGQEIDIAPLLNRLLDQGITVVCPKALPHRILENRVLTSLNDLESGVMGTQHPAAPEPYAGTYDLIIVPGLAFDARNYRLGYGGGYYDSFVVQHPEALKVGICYPFQQVAAVPTEPHDLVLDSLLVGEL